MLVGYTGTPRSGKSYDAVKNWYLPTLKNNVDNDEPMHIYTNLRGLLDDDCVFATAEQTGLSIAEINEQVHLVESVWFMQLWLNVPDNSLVIADEAHKFWCSREWKSFPQEGRDYIAESGQHNVDIVWISQSTSSVEKWIVQRTETINSALNLAFLGMPNRYIMRIRDGMSDYSNMKPRYGKYDPKIYACYKSFQVDPSKVRKKDTQGIFGTGFKLFALFVLFGFCYALWLIFGSDEEPPQAMASVYQEEVSQVMPHQVNQVKDQEEVSQVKDQEEVSEFTKLWITGVFYRAGKKNHVFLENDDLNQFRSTKIGMNFIVNNQGLLLHQGKAYEVGERIEVLTSKLEHLSFKPKRNSNPDRIMRTYTPPTPGFIDTRRPKNDGMQTRYDSFTDKFVPHH